MRNVSNKFQTCFHLVVDIDAMLESRAVVNRSGIRRFACIPVAEKHDTKNLATKATFCKVVKPVVFETVLSTRARNKNLHGQNCFGSKRGYSAYVESSLTGDEKQAFVITNFEEIQAPEWSSSISSSNSLVSESKNMSKCESTKNQVEKQKFHYVGIYWFLISLVVTVFWGKINVIVLTSILLCFPSLWNSSCCWIEEVPKLWSDESKVYKIIHRDRSGRSTSGRNKERSQWALNLLRKILLFVLEGLL